MGSDYLRIEDTTTVISKSNSGEILLSVDETKYLLESKLEKKQIMKNIFLISFAFMLIFNVGGLNMIQSSLHRVEGMGVITTSVSYASLMLSCMFLPKMVIKLIGHKWTIALSFWSFILYIAANGYAVWATMITASVIMGVCAAPLWAAQCSYFTISGKRYAVLNNEDEKAVVSRFFGIFFTFFRIGELRWALFNWIHSPIDPWFQCTDSVDHSTFLFFNE